MLGIHPALNLVDIKPKRILVDDLFISLSITKIPIWTKRKCSIVKLTGQTYFSPTIYPYNLLTQSGASLNIGSMHIQINRLIGAAVEWWTKPISRVSTACPPRVEEKHRKGHQSQGHCAPMELLVGGSSHPLSTYD